MSNENETIEVDEIDEILAIDDVVSMDSLQYVEPTINSRADSLVDSLLDESDFIDSVDGVIDFKTLVARWTKMREKTKNPRLHRLLTIVLNERKPEGFDIWVNSFFNCEGGRKYNKIGMETNWGARKIAVELYRKLQYNSEHKKKKYTTVEIVEHTEDKIQAPITSADSYHQGNKRPYSHNYRVRDFIKVTGEDGVPRKKMIYRNLEWKDTVKLVFKTKTKEFYNNYYELVSEQYTVAHIPRILHQVIAAIKRKSRAKSIEGFIPVAALSMVAKQYWKGVTITEIAQSLARKKKRKWCRSYAMLIMRQLDNLNESLKINLALQSILVEATGLTKLPDLGTLVIPSEHDEKRSLTFTRFCEREAPRTNQVSERVLKHEVIVTLTGDDEGNNSPYIVAAPDIKDDSHLWEVKEIKLSGSEDKISIPCFKKPKEVKASDIAIITEDSKGNLIPYQKKEYLLEELPVNSTFEFLDESYLCLEHQGNITRVSLNGKEILVKGYLKVLAPIH